MSKRYVCAALVLAGVAVPGAAPKGQAPNQASLVTQTVAGVKFSTVPGFAIERMNPPDKGDSYVVITFDSFGRLVVSKEQDFPRILLDNDKDGIYESEKIISDKVRNCQGLWFEGRTLYASCAIVPTPEQVAAAPPPAPGGGRGGPNINNLDFSLFKNFVVRPEAGAAVRPSTTALASSGWKTPTATTWPIRSRSWRWPARFRSTVPTRSAAAPTAASPSSSATTKRLPTPRSI